MHYWSISEEIISLSAKNAHALLYISIHLTISRSVERPLDSKFICIGLQYEICCICSKLNILWDSARKLFEDCFL